MTKTIHKQASVNKELLQFWCILGRSLQKTMEILSSCAGCAVIVQFSDGAVDFLGLGSPPGKSRDCPDWSAYISIRLEQFRERLQAKLPAWTCQELGHGTVVVVLPDLTAVLVLYNCSSSFFQSPDVNGPVVDMWMTTARRIALNEHAEVSGHPVNTIGMSHEYQKMECSIKQIAALDELH
ncbi:MAG: hypothetical protein WCR20_13855, partial [Verrucomicrobiota bacterium]